MSGLIYDGFWVIVALVLAVALPAPFGIFMAFCAGILLCSWVDDFRDRRKR